MTVKKLSQAIGQKVYYNVDALKIICEVYDVRLVWQKPQLLISPVAGKGEKWVALTSVSYYPGSNSLYELTI